MAAHGHEPAMGPSDETTGQSHVQQRAYRVHAVHVLREAHGPDEDRVWPIDEQPGETLDVGTRSATLDLNIRPRRRPRRIRRRLETGRVLRHERVIDSVHLEQRLQRPDQKRQVTAGVHRKPVIRQLRSEQRALGDGRDPVALEPRLAQRIDDGHLRAPVARVEQVFRGDRLVIGRVRPEEHDQVGPDPVRVAAGGRAVAERVLHGHCRGRVAQSRGVVDIGGAVNACSLLCHVIRLVGDAARCEVERRTRRIDGAKV